MQFQGNLRASDSTEVKRAVVATSLFISQFLAFNTPLTYFQSLFNLIET